MNDREEAWPPSSFVEELRDNMELKIDDHEVVDKLDAAVGESALVTDAAVVAEGMEEASLLSSFEKQEFRDDTDFVLVSVVVVGVAVEAPFSLHRLAAAAAAAADPSNVHRHLIHYSPITPLQQPRICHHAYSHVDVPWPDPIVQRTHADAYDQHLLPPLRLRHPQ